MYNILPNVNLHHLITQKRTKIQMTRINGKITKKKESWTDRWIGSRKGNRRIECEPENKIYKKKFY